MEGMEIAIANGKVDGETIDAAALARLYPGGKPEYLKKF
jgi:hypothetical protein